MDAGVAIDAGAIRVALTLPQWATFTWPTAVAADE
jgi:hypothetical protein